MKYERVKKGAVVFNKVDRKYYVATEPCDNGFLLKECDEENEIILDGKSVVAKESNAICFRCVKDSPAEVPEGNFTVVNGQIMKDGVKLVSSQGDIEAITILGTDLNTVIFYGKRKNEYGVMSYNLAKCEFRSFIHIAGDSNVIPVSSNEHQMVLSVTRHLEVTKKDASGVDITTKELVTSEVWVINNRGSLLVADLLHNDFVLDNPLVVNTEARVSIIAGYVFIPVIDEKGNKGYVLSFKFNGEIEKIFMTDEELTFDVSYRKELFVMGDSFVWYNGFEFKGDFTSLKNFKYLIDITLKDNAKVYTVADEELNTKTFSVEKTHDRGDVVIIY